MTASDYGPDRSAAGPDGEDAASPDELRLFQLLDRYLASLQSGDFESRTTMLKRHPELARWMRCLELLDRLGPEREPANSAASPSEFLALEPFGKYELQGEIGRGGMGVVFRARQTDLDRVVALKMILTSRLASPDDVRRFYAEARAAGSLRHPNIVGIHEVGDVNGQHFFSMDYVEGPSLAQALADGPFEARRAAQCAAAVARAVQYLHEHHIVHRDLKPSNILLSADGSPCVTDFGLAKGLGADAAHTQSGTVVGTLGYMAPEQAAGESAKISPRSDIYSLGAILFELLTGQPPFRNPSPFDTLLQVIDGQPPRPRQINPEVPPALEWICLKCLERDPQSRYASAAAVGDDLERFLRGEPPSVGPPGVVRSLVRFARQEPALASHLGAVFVVAVIVQAKYMISGSDGPFHLKVMGIFGGWALTALAWHGLLHGATRATALRSAWLATDCALLTLLLHIASAPVGPLLVGYPLLIVASGLFFRAQLVAFTTVASLVSYGLLQVLNRHSTDPPHYPLIYAAALAVMGLVVGYQAHRVRVLTGCFEDRARA